MPDPRAVAAQVMDLLHQPRIDEGTPLEDIHLQESITDILEEALNEEYRDGVIEGERNSRFP
jgi:hypothetical protein